MAEHVVAETKYSKKARKMGLASQVFVEFVIDTDGSVINVSILCGIHPLLDN
ncbi:MAG: energy transducer TonB [Flavobacteriales bacterium]